MVKLVNEVAGTRQALEYLVSTVNKWECSKVMTADSSQAIEKGSVKVMKAAR
jgi:hypothetical protein